MATCDVLYNPDKHRIALTSQLQTALRMGNLKFFLNNFLSKHRRSGDTKMRLVPTSADSENEVMYSMNMLLTDIDNVLRGWDQSHPGHVLRDTVMSTILEALNISDDSQTYTAEENSEIKTKEEAADQNVANLKQHLTEFYGLEAYDITASLKQTFEDLLAAAAYYDVNSGEIIEQTNTNLNATIQQRKNDLFATIVSYLKAKFPNDVRVQHLTTEMYQGGQLNVQNYYQGLNLFYNLVAKDPNFRTTLQSEHTNKVQEQSRQDKTKEYQRLVTELQKDESFNEAMKRRFTVGKLKHLAVQLYTADHYSEYYAAVKKYVLASKPEFTEWLRSIEQPTLGVLDAANAYTMLQHFDSLLKEVYGDQISITSGTAGFETNIENKYFYHQDTSHERKGWQTSEDIGSERHTARFTNAVMRMIRIFDYKTGEFMHRRVDSTTLIVAARNLINAVSTGKVAFAEKGSTKDLITELKDRIVMFHNNPVVQLQRILELLFDPKNPLVDSMTNRKVITDYDLSVLKSVYNTVFDKTNPQSFYTQSVQATKEYKQATQSLLEEMAGFIDRNVSVAYLETVYDFETGATTVRAKKKFFNSAELYKLQSGINIHVNELTPDQRTWLQQTYQLRVEENNTSNTRYTVTIAGKDFTLKIPNSLTSQILAKNLTKGPQMSFEAESGLFKALDGIDLVEFRYKLLSATPLTESEKVLHGILDFLDATLNLGILSNTEIGLQTLQSYKQIYNPVDGFDNYLMPLLKLGMRAAYANTRYVAANELGLNLGNYLTSQGDSIYKAHLRDKKSKIFTNRFNDVRYQIASYADDVLGVWVDAQSILKGAASKATTKDKQGNSIPNNSVSKLGGILRYYLAKQFDTNMSSLLFAQNPDLIKDTFHDLEVTNMQGESKSIRDFSNGELFYHAIFNKFWGSYIQNKTLIVQPTTYSDKTTFLNWEINAAINGVDLTKATTEQILQLYRDTIGEAYKRSFQETQNKLVAITTEYAKQHNLPAADYRDIMHQMSEQDLVQTAAKLGLEVEVNKDYKVLGSNSLGVNGTLEYNSKLFSDFDLLAQKLNKEKALFVNQLLLNGCIYQVLEHNDTLDMYTDDQISEEAKSQNPILATIIAMYEDDVQGRKDFFNKWVDSDTGRLILAKQHGNDIISVSDNFKVTETTELNPILEKFFYAEGLLSNNLRFSLTGFEVNHNSGKNSPLKALLKVQTLEEWNQQFGKQYGELTISDWALFRTPDQKGILDEIKDADDLARVLEANPSLTPAVKTALTSFLTDVFSYETNTAQGTQFKRNVIIPATLQYITQNSKDGVPTRIKCAVIHDTEANVWNYRGDNEKPIDACDGSAKITPFQSILENRALGSQAVGFIKKPIWHAYDTASGTAFLAKFATDTITNESMRMSLNSKGPDYRLFKKATNLQWSAADQIDLTKSLVRSQSFGDSTDVIANNEHQRWFKSVILQEGRLFYTDKYGAIQEIVGFNVTRTKGGQLLYYTEEKLAGLQSAPVVRKYHLFHDETAPDGAVTTSVHTTVETYQQALEQMAQYQTQGTEVHTINSLFELHAALGGINCVNAEGVGSEFNNEVVVNFMCNVGSVKSGTGKNQYISQETYNQPLKQYQIGYLFNQSAVKNGAKNINPATAWLDDSALTTFEVDSDGLGMQMNADHDIINSELTEFSQVIAATAAYGYTYDNCSEIFKGLANTAFQASEKTLTAVNKFLQLSDEDKRGQAASELYDSIGRILLTNQSIKDRESLTHIIMEAVNKVFNKYKDHTKDEVKIPFSDPNVYSEFISTLASTITKSSIKRSHPGSGCVMVPGYNMIQYSEIKDPKTGQVEKLLSTDILKRARAEYRNDLQAFLLSQMSSEEAATQQRALRRQSLQALEALALQADSTGAFSSYFTSVQDVTLANKHLIQTYLKKQQDMMPTYTDRSYFMPSDNVEIYNPDGTWFGSISLDKDLGQYYKFKEQGILDDGRIIPPGATYKSSTVLPYNLRPSLIRWQYQDANGNIRYKNIFDLQVIRDAYTANTNKQPLPPNHRTLVQDILHRLEEKGEFIDENGKTVKIVEGSLENTAAELVMSNLYKETFGVDNESLAEVLAQGEEYFLNQIKTLHTPYNSVYDIAFMRDNGKHTLITIGEVALDDTIRPETISNVMTNEKDEIVAVSGGRELFEVGKWQYNDQVTFNPKSKLFESDTEDISDQTKFRLKDGRVQQRYDYVTRYTVSTRKTGKNGSVTYQNNTLYKVANVDVIKKALGSEASDTDAMKQQSSIICKIYTAGDYKFAQLNAAKPMGEHKQNAVQNALQFMLTNYYIDPDVKQVLQKQSSLLGTNIKQNIEEFNKIKQEFLQKQAHKKYVSFLDSLNFISSRIPAQTLQSFMAMRLVAWTENSKNMAYVSHFQTYLQGSDYDIDKAYIMGQSYDANSVYVKWSPYFDYTTLETLTLSKALPVPKNTQIVKTEDGIDLTDEINTLVRNAKIGTIDGSDKTQKKILITEGLTPEQKVTFLKTLANVIRKAESNKGQISYHGELSTADQQVVINTLNHHEKYKAPSSLAEASYKNVASANIYAVSHDIRNRDQAYTAIAMDEARRVADNSPKGEQTAHLSMLNPLTKYIMQYQNLVGKNVIGITANGEKFWFNAYYYWTTVLSSGSEADLEYLKFNQTLTRVKNRASAKTLAEIASHTVTHLPDLNIRNQQLKAILESEFGATTESEQYKYVDQMISQLLSAATDNAKELILAKINAGTNYAKMYLYLITMGYKLDDIAAFMYSPIAEFIDSRSATNMFSAIQGAQGPVAAIDAALGKVQSRHFLHGTITSTNEEEDTTVTVPKHRAVANSLSNAIQSNTKLDEAVHKVLNKDMDISLDTVYLDDLMQALIKVAVEHPRILSMSEDFKMSSLMESSTDVEVNNYLRYCQDLIQQLWDVKSRYQYQFSEMMADAAEFKKIFNLASEMSSIASAFLGLNQGLPTDKLGLLKKLNAMRRIVTDREQVFEIRENELYNSDDSPEQQTKTLAAWDQVISNIQENNPMLEAEYIRQVLDSAHEAGIMNHFDITQLLVDPEYKQIVKDYLHVLKGTINVVDMFDKIPHYTEILNCLKALVVADKSLSVKSRLIGELLQQGASVGDAELRGVIRYVDRLNIINFLDSEAVPIFDVGRSVQGFNTTFDTVQVDRFDLTTPEGVASFVKFVETDFLSELQEKHQQNPMVKHLTKVLANGRTILTTKIDLLNPNTTTASRVAYDDILRGISLFEGVRYNDDYTIADIFQLYNLIVNSNQYGAERLTTIFKVCQDKNSILQKFLNFTATQDYDTTFIPEYQQIDYQINAAPLVSPAAERFQTAPFIKVKDPIWDYVIKRYDPKTNQYQAYPLLPAFREGNISDAERDQRRINFASYYPFEMPQRAKARATAKALTFTGDITDDVRQTLRTVLVDLSKSGKIILAKIC